MSIDYKNYPANWKTEIRPRILKRANDCCERCKAKNYSVVCRGKWQDSGGILVDAYQDDDGNIFNALNGLYLGQDYVGEVWQGKNQRITKIILTIAHVGKDKSPMNCRDEDLLALCQRCHLIEDKESHAKKRRETLIKKKNQIHLF